MGTGPGRTTGPRRVSGRLGAAVVAAVAGAAVAVAAGHRRRRARAIAPADAVAGLPEELVGPAAPSAPPTTADGGRTAEPAAGTPTGEPGRAGARPTAPDAAPAWPDEQVATGAPAAADVVAPGEDAPPAGEPEPAPGAPTGRRRAWPAAVAALVLAGASAGLLALAGSGDDDRQIGRASCREKVSSLMCAVES